MRIAAIQLAYGDDESLHGPHRAGRGDGACRGRCRPGRATGVVVGRRLLLPRAGRTGRRPSAERSPRRWPMPRGTPASWLHGGSIASSRPPAETGPEGKSLWNTSVLFGPGRVARRDLPKDPPLRVRRWRAHADGGRRRTSWCWTPRRAAGRAVDLLRPALPGALSGTGGRGAPLSSYRLRGRRHEWACGRCCARSSRRGPVPGDRLQHRGHARRARRWAGTRRWSARPARRWPWPGLLKRCSALGSTWMR